MKDVIINGLNEKKLKGAICQFNYHGWLVSFSQLFPKATVAIFKDDVEIFDFFNPNKSP